ncbi:MAG: presqualene diphosphate synthase HpnD [Verrucomicrobia bacterium]|nr:presqualene diphosphate synthase HpnD [Verrucomicrobiota bacterium]
MSLLEHSYRHCQRVAKTRAKNFYYSFFALPKEKRGAMCAIYAFFRYCDDLSDDASSVEAARANLHRWRAVLDAAYAGTAGASLLPADQPGASSANAMLPAFADTVKRYSIPKEYFADLITGAEMDLDVKRYETFEDLYRYCYRVASCVGLSVIHIFGFADKAAEQHAEECGIAFQLTNILRDVREDAQMGRIYLPLEDLRRFGVTEEQILSAQPPPAFVDLMRFESQRAHDYYEKARPLLHMIHADSREALVALLEIYHGLLKKIEHTGFDVFARRVSLPTWKKVLIALKSVLRSRGSR